MTASADQVLSAVDRTLPHFYPLSNGMPMPAPLQWCGQRAVSNERHRNGNPGSQSCSQLTHYCPLIPMVTSSDKELVTPGRIKAQRLVDVYCEGGDETASLEHLLITRYSHT